MKVMGAVLIAVVSWLPGLVEAATPEAPSRAEVLAALKAGDPEATLDGLVNWNGHAVALTRTAHESEETVRLVAFKKKGKRLVTVGTTTVCSLEHGPDEGRHSCAFDDAAWNLTDALPAIAVIEETSSPEGRDSSTRSKQLHLYWLDAAGLRSVLDLALERHEDHSDFAFPTIDETREAEVSTTRTLGFNDVSVKRTVVETPTVGDGPPRGGPPVEPTTTSSTEVYRFDGVGYGAGSPLPRPTVTASSTLVEKGRAASFYAPERIQDGKLSTAWAEGVPGPGIGESLTFIWKAPVKAGKLAIYAACSDSPKLFADNHRIKSLEVVLSSGFKTTLPLQDVMRVQHFALPNAGSITSATLTIREVFQGAKYDDTCIAEAFFE